MQAWQYLAQHRSEWPAWVQRCCIDCGTELILERRSGRQVVLLGEWLVKDLDEADPLWLTDREYQRDFKTEGALR